MTKIRKITAVFAAVIITMTLTACTESERNKQARNVQGSGQDETVAAFEQQRTTVPYPASELKDSTERRNLAERLRRTNKANAIGYVYLLSFGKPLGYYTIKGKVSSTQSQMTTGQLVLDRDGGDVTVDAPGDDGSYGENERGVFFFTTEGAMVTTNLDYVVSDQPLPLDVPDLNKKGTGPPATPAAK